MSDQPFFRGENQMDWLFAVSLQSAVDWSSDAVVQEVADALGFEGMITYTFPNVPGLGKPYPGVALVSCTDYLFVVSQSTKGTLQWLGNLLGSTSGPAPFITGSVASYFGLAASNQYGTIRQAVLDNIGSKRLVFIGFSLGASTAALMKEMFENDAGLTGAAVVFGCPRTGLANYVDNYPTENFFRLQCVNDPVASVPPIPWAGTGFYNVWTPFPPFVTYVSQVPSYRLSFPGNVDPGDFVQPIEDVILSFDSSLYEQFHNQRTYAGILRFNLPSQLEDGFQGYPKASKLDPANRIVFEWSPLGWTFGEESSVANLEGVNMPVQGVMYFRNSQGVPLGFSEPMYFATGDPASLSGVMDGIVSQRQKFLSKSCEIFAQRVSIVGGPRQSFLTKYIVPKPGLVGKNDDKIEPAITYFGYSTSRLHKRLFHFRGIADTWLDTDALTGTGLGSLSLITSYLSFLSTVGAGILIKKGTGPFMLQSGSQTGQNTLITITVDPSFTAVPSGTPVIITGCKAAPFLNGTWLTQGVGAAPNQLTLSGSYRYSCPTVLNGKLFLAAPSVVGISETAFNGVTKHDTGRPAFLQRGRQSAKIRRR